ncbi:hypothetical protein IX84_17375 [Phaeodactylibacter xiamenensis]|uniref:Uncharacterized protein n=1 Tax=Phaeodactylibacter xiamenensis TaxID=1524460 RepID=A0A098S421_9BACT|nr:hypothetical protein IX84_17375 [Phaeodactylibacter xiamenensis]
MSNIRILGNVIAFGGAGVASFAVNEAGAERLVGAWVKLYTSNPSLLSKSFPPGTYPGSGRLSKIKLGQSA